MLAENLGPFSRTVEGGLALCTRLIFRLLSHLLHSLLYLLLGFLSFLLQSLLPLFDLLLRPLFALLYFLFYLLAHLVFGRPSACRNSGQADECGCEQNYDIPPHVPP
jgi:hypothetical protein